MKIKSKRGKSFKCVIGAALIMAGIAVIVVGSSGIPQSTSLNVAIVLLPAAGDTPPNIAVGFMLIPAEEDITLPRRGGGAPCDTDGDGYTDIEEMLAGTDKDDPCDPNPEHPMCKPKRTPQPVTTLTPAPTTLPLEPIEPIPTPVPALAPTPVQTPAEEEETSRKTLIIVSIILGLLIGCTIVVYAWWSRR